MPLKIRCPECKHIMVVGDDLAGRVTHCAVCDVAFNVPMPVRGAYEAGATELVIACPHCQHQNAPGTTTCRRCGTNLQTGRRPRWWMRYRYWGLRTWLDLAGLAALGIVLAIIVSSQLQRAEQRRRVLQTPVTAQSDWPPAHRDTAHSLLAAETLVAHREALLTLQSHGADAALAVAAALNDSLANPEPTPLRERNRQAALIFLGEHAHADPPYVGRWRGLLIRARQRPTLRNEATYALAMLGESFVRDDVADAWQAALRRWLFVEQSSRVAPRPAPRGMQTAVARVEADLWRYTQAVRRLAGDDPNAMLEPLALGYWDSWAWLGQRRGERYATALFDAAKPYRPGQTGPTPRSEAEEVENIRTAREALEVVGVRAEPLAAAAAAVVMVQHMPQYQSARERIENRLVGLLPDQTPRTQQLMVWALARSTGRIFALYSDKQDPYAVGLREVIAALEALSQVDSVTRTRLSRLTYPQPTVLTYRVTQSTWVSEQDLLEQMSSWPSTWGAIERWRAQGLGLTPALRRRLDPTQDTPDPSALAAAIVLAAEADVIESVRPPLDLWAQAYEQPAWVRGLALTALGTLDARQRSTRSDWPAAIEPAALPTVSVSGPSWDYYGLLLALGGEPMQRRLRDADELNISDDQRRRWLDAATRFTDDD